jgi:hypothetical protein
MGIGIQSAPPPPSGSPAYSLSFAMWRRQTQPHTILIAGWIVVRFFVGISLDLIIVEGSCTDMEIIEWKYVYQPSVPNIDRCGHLPDYWGISVILLTWSHSVLVLVSKWTQSKRKILIQTAGLVLRDYDVLFPDISQRTKICLRSNKMWQEPSKMPGENWTIYVPKSTESKRVFSCCKQNYLLNLIAFGDWQYLYYCRIMLKC